MKRFVYTILLLSNCVGVEARADRSDLCFGTIDERTTLKILEERCGKPSRDVGSGLYVLEWDLSNGSRLSASTGGRELFSATLTTKDGATTILFNRQHAERKKNESRRAEAEPGNRSSLKIEKKGN